MVAYVYIAKFDSRTPVKIGMTTNPEKRIETIRTYSPFGAFYEAVYEIENTDLARKLEQSAHLFLKDLRLAGREWFDLDPRSASAVVRGLAAYDGISIREAVL